MNLNVNVTSFEPLSDFEESQGLDFVGYVFCNVVPAGITFSVGKVLYGKCLLHLDILCY